MVMLIYMFVNMFRGEKLDMKCLDRLAEFLLYAVIVDFSLEMLDFIHRLYQSEDSIEIISQLITTKLFISLVIVQILLGIIIPVGLIVIVKFFKYEEELRRLIYFLSALLIQMGIFSTRWNVVIGGQLFSKSFRGLTVYKMDLFGVEGLFVAIFFLILPFFILHILARILPPWTGTEQHT